MDKQGESKSFRKKNTKKMCMEFNSFLCIYCGMFQTMCDQVQHNHVHRKQLESIL